MKIIIGSHFISRLIVGSILIYAGLYKIINPASFEKTLNTYDFFSNSFIGFIVFDFPLDAIDSWCVVNFRLFGKICGFYYINIIADIYNYEHTKRFERKLSGVRFFI